MSVVDSPELLTASWLSQALEAEVASVSWKRVGSGQIGACYRLELTGGPGVPGSLIAKLPAEDEGSRAFLGPAYRTEVSFYRDLAHTVAARVPVCHHSAISEDGTVFTLLLEDAFPAVQGDQLAGCSPDQAFGAVVNLAGLHGPRWCDPTLLDLPWLGTVGEEDAATLGEVFAPAVEIFVDRFAAELSGEDKRTLRETAEHVAAWVLGRSERFGPVHGDYRPDNLLFSPGDGERVIAVDWQTLSLGHPVRDLSFFLGTGLLPEDRAAREHDLVAAYHEALQAYGVADYSLRECFDDYRFAAVQGPLITVLGCAYGTPTERGDRMFLAMAARSCAMIRELGTLDLI
ncbi:phosphotransferase family protein [Actinocorallia populi]|uniref:phosphotransferase family protein n=1 Tax=Actinocorallia populi TaxID=2079200 RepID=UPI000D096961|nr:aminoglycoside phosphotransferase family protein [Actinocorallia populi]